MDIIQVPPKYHLGIIKRLPNDFIQERLKAGQCFVTFIVGRSALLDDEHRIASSVIFVNSSSSQSSLILGSIISSIPPSLSLGCTCTMALHEVCVRPMLKMMIGVYGPHKFCSASKDVAAFNAPSLADW